MKAKARVHGFRLTFSDAAITIRRGGQALSLPFSHFVEVPITLECFDDFFRSVEPQQREGLLVLDFSTPGLHVYRRGGIAFHFPGVPEEDSMDAYTHWYRPRPGDVVWDAGAHAGATTYFLSQAVGDAGRVYAFEPDEVSFEFLLRNIAAHKLTNVVPVNKALTDKTGTVTFQSDGTLSAGIKDYLLYADRGTSVKVPAISLPDACEEFGGVPNYVKMDIEGAELAVIEGAREFLKRHPIHFAIESYHPMDGDFTYKALDRIFPTLGYEVESSAQFGQMFTWARV
ncbi:MAG TPA: FkbM family methyltransferase [Candidatus Solibacter sp.]|nr:FkbM family methyltransferase [Candidatus Solibacter sp.]